MDRLQLYTKQLSGHRTPDRGNMRETSLCLLVLISFFQICENKNQPKGTGDRVQEYFQQPRVATKNAPPQRFGGGNRNLKGGSACKDKASNCREAAKKNLCHQHGQKCKKVKVKIHFVFSSCQN